MFHLFETSTVVKSITTNSHDSGLYLSYGLPILLGLLNPVRFGTLKGPFNLGKFSKPVALVASLWIAFITIVFCLPGVHPVTRETLNYTPVAVGIITVGAGGSWLLWARKWFVGPLREIEAERAGIDIEDEEAMARAEKDGVIPHSTKNTEP